MLRTQCMVDVWFSGAISFWQSFLIEITQSMIIRRLRTGDIKIHSQIPQKFRIGGRKYKIYYMVESKAIKVQLEISELIRFTAVL